MRVLEKLLNNFGAPLNYMAEVLVPSDQPKIPSNFMLAHQRYDRA